MNLELREQVARMMGWTRHEDGTLTEPEENNEGYGLYGYTPDELPPFEEDIATAWQVVEFMRDKKKKLLRLYERERGDWFAEFVPIELGRAYRPGCVASTATLAICMAFVAAMENNHES